MSQVSQDSYLAHEILDVLLLRVLQLAPSEIDDFTRDLFNSSLPPQIITQKHLPRKPRTKFSLADRVDMLKGL